MALRPAKCYRSLERPYTRVSIHVPRKSYVKGVPVGKIHRFEMGNKSQSYTLRIDLVAVQGVQIRHNALEAARVAANKGLDKWVGPNAYFLKILAYPHHVLRENPLATGAGADRFSTGMRQSFGNPISTAARVLEGNKIMSVWVEPGKGVPAKRAFKVAASKVPTPCLFVESTTPGAGMPAIPAGRRTAAGPSAASAGAAS
ncbi:MAG TPA: 50S ribosomal protein L16 [archaeon]|nr:50S ribosomal protein L16 [archaeon]